MDDVDNELKKKTNQKKTEMEKEIRRCGLQLRINKCTCMELAA